MIRGSNFKTGITLVEVIIAATIILLLISSLVSINNLYLKSISSGVKKVKAALLTEEGIEAVKLLRDQNWTKNIAAIPLNTNYYLAYNSGNNFWATSTTNTYIDSTYERKFTLASVYRDGNSDIASSGTLDPNARKVTVTVSWWEKGATSTKSISTYTVNLMGN